MKKNSFSVSKKKEFFLNYYNCSSYQRTVEDSDGFKILPGTELEAIKVFFLFRNRKWLNSCVKVKSEYIAVFINFILMDKNSKLISHQKKLAHLVKDHGGNLICCSAVLLMTIYLFDK